MALTRAYPNNIAHDGTNIRDGFSNDDKEIKRIYAILDTKGSGGGSTSSNGNGARYYADRQRIISAPETYLRIGANGDNYDVAILGEDIPIKVSFAAGFDVDGETPIDHDETITSYKANAWTLGREAEAYHLYIQRDRYSGLISYGASPYRDKYGTAFPGAAKDGQFYFHVAKMKMYKWATSAWEEVQAVFVADVDMRTITGGLPTITLRGTASELAVESIIKSVGDNGALIRGRDGKPADLHVGKISADEPVATALVANKWAKPVQLRLHDASSVVSVASLDGSSDIDLHVADLVLDNVARASISDEAKHAREADEAKHTLQADQAMSANQAQVAATAHEASHAKASDTADVADTARTLTSNFQGSPHGKVTYDSTSTSEWQGLKSLVHAEKSGYDTILRPISTYAAAGSLCRDIALYIYEIDVHYNKDMHNRLQWALLNIMGIRRDMIKDDRCDFPLILSDFIGHEINDKLNYLQSSNVQKFEDYIRAVVNKAVEAKLSADVNNMVETSIKSAMQRSGYYYKPPYPADKD